MTRREGWDQHMEGLKRTLAACRQGTSEAISQTERAMAECARRLTDSERLIARSKAE